MSTNVNLGFLALGETNTRNGFMQAGSTQEDTYAFSTGSVTANVAISSSGSTNSPFGLQLFRDNNGDGIVNAGDTFANSSDGTSDFDGANESMNTLLSQGNYIARFRAFATDNISYNFQISRASVGGANPLAAPEIQLGTIDKDLKRSNSVNNNDTADNFAFSLDANDSLKIGVRELGQKGNVTARVVQDDNGNGIVDKGEIVARGISSANGNIDTISGIKGAGDYILQVCQQAGSTNFQVNFDHSAIS